MRKNPSCLLSSVSVFSTRSAFTLVELMIVIAIIWVLSSSLYGMYMNYVHKAEITSAKVFISKFQYLEPVLQYDFDTQSGTTVIDKSGKRNDGVMHGGAYSTDVPYGSGYSYAFSGVLNTQAQWIQSSQPIYLVQDTGFTIMYWIKTTDNGNGWFAVANAWSSLGYRTWLVGGVPYFFIGSDPDPSHPTPSYYTSSSCAWKSVNDWAWHHVAFSLATSELKIFCFVDWKKQSDVNVTPQVVGNVGTWASWIWSPYSNTPFSWLIDDVQIRWGVVLR